MAKLTIKDESGRVRSYLLNDAVTMAGRASSNAIQINDEKSSRQHFKIERRDGGFYVVDMGSTNGTRLNGDKLALPTELHSGDTIAVGKLTLTFQAEDGGDTPSRSGQDAPSGAGPSPDEQDRATMIADARMQKTHSDERVMAAATMPIYVLRLLEGATPGKVFELGKEPLTLGRHPSNTIHIDDEAASNYHAEVSREPIGYIVSDLGSTNGTKVKPKDKFDFEKVVKTPLKPGMQIKIGKTLIEFQNIGAPVENDEEDGDSISSPANKLDAPIGGTGAAYIGGGGGSGLGLKIGIAAAAVVVLGLGVWFALPLFKGSAGGGGKVATTDATPEKVKTFNNLIQNNSFDQETDEAGDPKEFQVQKGWPEASVSITTDAERQSEKADAQKHGLQISKGGAKKLLQPTIVETRDSIPIEPTKTYEISGWMRNDEDGIYGMRVVWSEGERTLAESPIVLKGSQSWGKEPKSAVVTPPAWATRARIGVFVQGQNGKACFDDLGFKEKQGSVPQRATPVKNNGIVLQFEGAKGAFSVMSQGKVVLEDGTLRLESAEIKAGSELAMAIKPTLTKTGEPNSAGYEGRIFDFAQKDLTNFTIGAKPGSSGVDLNASVEMLPDTTSRPMLRFYIAGGAGQGDVEIGKPDGPVTRVPGSEDREDTGVKSVLFNAGKTPQFDLLFKKPAAIRLKHEGKRCLVEIRFEGEILVSLAPEDVGQKQEMVASAADLKKSIEAKEWGTVETKLKAFNEKYAARFAEAKDEAAKTKDAMEAAWKATQDEGTRLIAALQATPKTELLDAARKANQRHADAWKGSEKEPQVADMKTQIEALGDTLSNADAEKKAKESLDSAQKNFDAGNFEVAVAILKTKIIDDPKMSKTKVADLARDLLPKAETAFQQQKDVDIIQNNLRQIVKGLIGMKNYKEAIRTIETDPEYKANKAKLKEINELLDDLRKKAGQ